MVKQCWLLLLLFFPIKVFAINEEKVKQVVAEIESQMVTIPAGSFVMGEDSDTIPVTIKSFMMGKYEVSFAQWDACVLDGGCRYSPDDIWGRDKQPIMRVSYNDIVQQFIPWLNEKTGKTYRLPSESEWEYAARAGTSTRFNTGDCISTDQANFNGNRPDSGCAMGIYRERTLTVDSFLPNQFGLHNMHGNVWEWTEDCWNGDNSGHSGTQRARLEGRCDIRVVRGGSWIYEGGYLRSANRNLWSVDFRDYGDLGFRLSRSL